MSDYQNHKVDVGIIQFLHFIYYCCVYRAAKSAWLMQPGPKSSPQVKQHIPHTVVKNPHKVGMWDTGP